MEDAPFPPQQQQLPWELWGGLPLLCCSRSADTWHAKYLVYQVLGIPSTWSTKYLVYLVYQVPGMPSTWQARYLTKKHDSSNEDKGKVTTTQCFQILVDSPRYHRHSAQNCARSFLEWFGADLFLTFFHKCWGQGRGFPGCAPWGHLPLQGSSLT